ncbi:MAG TPA: LysR substrate-binding domain-containing protein [Myxococcales bacterium]|nr:LysR substrate-binding domain-containing protein [Myxococcales bacterium]
MKDLPLELLRTFIATVDTGSMAKASGVVGRTPSAVSLQMSRLGELIGQPLFQRRGRTQVLTRAGDLLIPHARDILGASERALAALSEERLQGPVRFGTVQDLADRVLPRVLADFARQYPGITLHVQVAQSAVLLEQARAGDLDFVVCFKTQKGQVEIRREPMVWLGHREVALLDPLPLAVLDPPCGYIEAATEALRRAGRPYHVVLRTPSLAGLRAALEAGLAVGCRTALLRSGSIEVLGEAERLPPLPNIAFSMYVPRPLSPAARRLATVVREVVSQRGAARSPAPSVALAAS